MMTCQYLREKLFCVIHYKWIFERYLSILKVVWIIVKLTDLTIFLINYSRNIYHSELKLNDHV